MQLSVKAEEDASVARRRGTGGGERHSENPWVPQALRKLESVESKKNKVRKFEFGKGRKNPNSGKKPHCPWVSKLGWKKRLGRFNNYRLGIHEPTGSSSRTGLDILNPTVPAPEIDQNLQRSQNCGPRLNGESISEEGTSSIAAGGQQHIRSRDLAAAVDRNHCFSDLVYAIPRAEGESG